MTGKRHECAEDQKETRICRRRRQPKTDIRLGWYSLSFRRDDEVAFGMNKEGEAHMWHDPSMRICASRDYGRQHVIEVSYRGYAREQNHGPDVGSEGSDLQGTTNFRLRGFAPLRCSLHATFGLVLWGVDCGL